MKKAIIERLLNGEGINQKDADLLRGASDRISRLETAVERSVDKLWKLTECCCCNNYGNCQLTEKDCKAHWREWLMREGE